VKFSAAASIHSGMRDGSRVSCFHDTPMLVQKIHQSVFHLTFGGDHIL
jgi:hypothetical protein